MLRRACCLQAVSSSYVLEVSKIRHKLFSSSIALGARRGQAESSEREAHAVRVASDASLAGVSIKANQLA